MYESGRSVGPANGLVVFILPLPIIRNLKISRKRERAGLLVLFTLGAITIFVSVARFIAMLLVTNNIAICKIAAPIDSSRVVLTIADILATTEFTVSIMIPSLISLRPLLRKVHKWTSSDYTESPFSPPVTIGQRKPGTSNTQKLKGSHAIYSRGHTQNMYGSEVELTEHEPIKIYKTEEISVTSIRDPQLGDRDHIYKSTEK